MLARALIENLSGEHIDFVSTDLDLDIADSDAVLHFAQSNRFSHVINCAAYTRVDDAETEIDLCHRTNAVGPGNLARAAAMVGAGLMHFSTDYVFDGRGRAPYTEDASCAPISVYGHSKHEGEQFVLATLQGGEPSNRRVHLIRTSWLFGEGGSNFVATMLRIMAARETVKVVNDQRGRPTYTKDLAQAALRLAGIIPGNRPAASGIYHFANAGETTWYGFAKSILAQSRELGIELRTHTIDPIATVEYPRPAPRPAYSVLCTRRFEVATEHTPRRWEVALKDYLIGTKQHQPDTQMVHV